METRDIGWFDRPIVREVNSIISIIERKGCGSDQKMGFLPTNPSFKTPNTRETPLTRF